MAGLDSAGGGWGGKRRLEGETVPSIAVRVGVGAAGRRCGEGGGGPRTFARFVTPGGTSGLGSRMKLVTTCYIRNGECFPLVMLAQFVLLRVFFFPSGFVLCFFPPRFGVGTKLTALHRWYAGLHPTCRCVVRGSTTQWPLLIFIRTAGITVTPDGGLILSAAVMLYF